MKKISLIALMLIFNSTIYSQNISSDSIRIEVFKKILDFVIPILKYQNTQKCSLYFGCMGQNGFVNVFDFRYFLDENQVEELIRETESFDLDMYSEDMKIINLVRSFLCSANSETRWMGLYFIDQYPSKILKHLIVPVINDYDPRVSCQVSLLLTKLIAEDQLIDAAYRLMFEQASSYNVVSNVMALELLSALNEKNYDVSQESVLKICRNHDHPLFQIAVLLMKERFEYKAIDRDVMLRLFVNVFNSVDEDVRSAGLQLLLKLKDHYEYRTFIGNILLLSMNDTPWIQMQTLSILSKLLDVDLGIENVKEIAEKACEDSDWHIRLGGVELLMQLLYSSRYDFDNDCNESEIVAKACLADDNIFLQFFGMAEL